MTARRPGPGFPALPDGIAQRAIPGDLNSVFNQLLELTAQRTGLKILFEDLSGITLDHPDLRLEPRFRVHDCAFCTLAKSTAEGHAACIRNKLAVNRRVRRRNGGLGGQCRLGLTDLAEPLARHGRLLGVFYFGSVVVCGTEVVAKANIYRQCRRLRQAPEPYLRILETVPRVTVEELGHHQRTLMLVRELSLRLIEACGLNILTYSSASGSQFMGLQRKLAPLVRAGIEFIQHRYAEALTLADAADSLGCHPDHLGRLFKAQTGLGFHQYLLRVRVACARRLLQSGRFNISQVCYQVGFQDQSHFGRVFRRLSGCTPSQYLHQHRGGRNEGSPSPA
ncbi:helix-turn-helix domain-containing protein [Ruficoccus amylovorans]|uniref:Helix-turn-helix domain-containing protein n=1 Tax=Ruficoccus amylovorans TaxID=1804625 RepID=A0A842H9S2_9BACT|nr:helix-turn-helix domain-containing protein [Ruficoccus amylovorans]MBC2593243.1 helix-turn-helix domain-containing protein [Ruficoccus amylovorans]